MLSFAGMLLSAVFFTISDDLVLLLLGPKWKQTGTVFRILSVGLGVMMVYNVQGWLHLSLGTPSRWFRWTLLGSVTKILLVCVALPWGLVPVAKAYVVAYYILVGFGLRYAGHPMAIGYWWIVSHLIRPFFAGLVAALVSLSLLEYIPAVSHAPILLRIVITTVACATVYLAATVVFNRSFRPLIECCHLLADMVPLRRK
jgi:PST family polysaccharide transporter